MGKPKFLYEVYEVSPDGRRHLAGKSVAVSEKEACSNVYFRDGYGGTRYKDLPFAYIARKVGPVSGMTDRVSEKWQRREVSTLSDMFPEELAESQPTKLVQEDLFQEELNAARAQEAFRRWY